MTDNLRDIPVTTLLDFVKEKSGSNSFCLAKWYNATIWLGSGMTTSCHHPPAHKIDVNELANNPSALHNTHEKKEQRKLMQASDRPAGCSYCWKMEDADKRNISDRVYKTRIYSLQDLYDAIKADHWQNFNLKTLEISFDRTCNLACSYCNPAFSTTWAKDIKQNGPYKNLNSDGRNHYTHEHAASQLYKLNEENPYVTAFFKWWETDLHKNLTELRITGGEPLMSKELWQLLDWYKTNNSNVNLAINTNLMAKDSLIDKLVSESKHINHLEVYTSIEAIGKRAEYIRDGLLWEKWEHNFNRMLTEANLKGLHIMATPSVLSICAIDEFLSWCLEKKKSFGRDAFTFTLNIMRFPSFQSIAILDDDIKKNVAIKLTSWLNNNDTSLLHQMEIDHINRLIAYLEIEESNDRVLLKQDLKSFLLQYDNRRNKHSSACPEIEEWLK